MVPLSEKKLGSWDTEVRSSIASGLGTSASVRPISDRLKPAEPPQDRRVLVSVPGFTARLAFRRLRLLFLCSFFTVFFFAIFLAVGFFGADFDFVAFFGAAFLTVFFATVFFAAALFTGFPVGRVFAGLFSGVGTSIAGISAAPKSPAGAGVTSVIEVTASLTMPSKFPTVALSSSMADSKFETLNASRFGNGQHKKKGPEGVLNLDF